MTYYVFFIFFITQCLGLKWYLQPGLFIPVSRAVLWCLAQGRCHVWPRLTEVSGVVLCRLTLFSTVCCFFVCFFHGSIIHKPGRLVSTPLFKEYVYSVSWIRKTGQCPERTRFSDFSAMLRFDTDEHYAETNALLHTTARCRWPPINPGSEASRPIHQISLKGHTHHVHEFVSGSM